MIVEIITDADGRPVGWTMTGENQKEINKLIDIRNMQFWGYGDTNIVYDGREGGNDKEHNPGTLKWKQKCHTKRYSIDNPDGE